MLSGEFEAAYLASLRDLYPKSAARIGADIQLSPTLISTRVVPIRRAALDRAQAIASAFERLRESPAYVARIAPGADPGNRAVLMSFDFHLLDGDRLKLIEINTNASLALMGDAAYRAQGLPNPFSDDFRADAVAMFRDEARLSKPGRELRRMAIVDRDPPQQRLFIEFLAYQELFERAGIACEICDTAAVGGLPHLDLIYNRDVDFYLREPASAGLREAIAANSACVTPGPVEYALLSDKARLIEIGAPGFLEEVLPDDPAGRKAIASSLLETRSVASFSREALWAERKRWFFKPQRAHGGKAAYRGSSIGRKAFESLFHGDFIAQEYAAPPELDGFKYDLRFFVYRGRVQLGLARLYQGQTTNSQTPGGGVACLKVEG